MKLKQTGIIALALALAGPVSADTVDENNVTIFESGTTLSSSAMNNTIGALIGAINDNASRIAALEEAPNMIADVTGNSYCVVSMDTGFVKLDNPVTHPAGDPDLTSDDVLDNGVFGASAGVYRLGITLAAGNTGSATVFQDTYREIFADRNDDTSEDTPGEMFQFTWTQEGNEVAIDFNTDASEGPEIATFSIDNSGSVAISADAYLDTGNDGASVWHSAGIIIGVKVDDISLCGGAVVSPAS